MIEGSLEVKLPTVWTDGKAQPGRSSALEKVRSEKIRDETDQTGRKSRKAAKHSVFPMFCGSGRSKSRLAKAACAEAPGQMRDEKVHALVARSAF